MNNAYYEIYRHEIFVMAKTLVIKLNDVAETINEYLTQQGVQVPPAEPERWKYYQNLAGEYHETDEVMTVRSMDTLEEITFSKDNLKRHRATYREYRYGSRYYQELLERYPDQALLINGILSPVDKQRAYDAADGEILYYDNRFVEGNETNLIPNLQNWIYVFLARWHNRQYNLQDDLYLPSMLGTLYLQIPGVIQTLRLENAKTSYAHSFHIREYLASNGRLDEYLPYLNKAQQLFLYRNLRWLRRNVGKQATLDLLVERILTARGLPLAAYRLRHNIEDMPEAVYPSIDLTKYPMNQGYNQTGINTASVYTVLDKERHVARQNPEVQSDTEQDLIRRMQRQWFSELPTKVMESEIEDRSNASVRSLENVLLTQWLYLATHDRYRAYINVANPGNGENMNLSVRDALIVATYAWHRARELPLDTIPRLYAYETLRDPLPTFDELRRLAPVEYVSDEMIAAVMDRITPVGEYISTEGFYNDASAFHQQYLRLWELYSFQEHMHVRGYMEQIVRRHYKHVKCALLDDEILSFEQYFKDKGIAVADLSPLDMEQLYVDCVKKATGADLITRKSIAELQRAMLSLMRQLSSYSVQFLTDINEASFWFVGQPATRLGDYKGATGDEMWVPLSLTTVLRQRAAVRQYRRIGHCRIFPNTTITGKARTSLHWDPSVDYHLRPRSLGRMALNTAKVGLRRLNIVVHTKPQNPDQLPGYRYPE